MGERAPRVLASTLTGLMLASVSGQAVSIGQPSQKGITDRVRLLDRFLEPDAVDLVRVEGDLSLRPSIWTRRVHIQRDYGRINGVHVPLSMSSTADVRLVGASTFSMTYSYVEINGSPVAR